MKCPKCRGLMEKEIWHYEDEDLIIYRCRKCGYIERHHYPIKKILKPLPWKGWD